MAEMGAMRFLGTDKFMNLYAEMLSLKVVNFTTPGVNDVLYHLRGKHFR